MWSVHISVIFLKYGVFLPRTNTFVFSITFKRFTKRYLFLLLWARVWVSFCHQISSTATNLNPNQQLPQPFTTISLQFSITTITAPFWRPQTAQRWWSRWQRFWRHWKIRQETATSQRWNTSMSICPSLWYSAHGRGPSSVCCSCWAPCGWDTHSTSSSGGRLS